jgi:uncharacterized protein
MIEIHETVSVPSDSQMVWDIISNPRTIVSCVPGASLGEQQDDGSWDAAVAVKFGPVKVTLQARVTLELDEPARVGHVTARGKDNQGGTRFTSTMKFEVKDAADSGSVVAIDGLVELAGKLAGVIEGGAPIVIRRMTNDFAENLAKRCALA